MVACTIDADGTVLTRARERSPVGDAGALLDLIAQLVKSQPSGLPVGIGVPGPVSLDGVIDMAPNLGVADLDVAGGLEERLGARPVITNDASAALIGERALGAARGHDHVVMITVGTGIGGAVIVDGQLLTGASGYAGELGHVLADPEGPTCGCGAVGCLEAVASGHAMVARAKAALADGEPSVLSDRDEIDGHALDEASAARDPLVRRVRADAAVHLGRAAASMVNIFDPSLVLLGGGAGVHAAVDLVPLMEQTMAASITGRHRTAPPIVVATLGDDAGMIGAALLAREATGRGT